MAQTKYITIAELKESFDSRMLGQLASYSGTPDALGDESNTVVLNAIEKASAEIQSYALRGNRYTADNLDTIKTDDDWTLKGLCATLTVKHLFRGKATQAPADIVQMIEEAKGLCEALGSGDRIFNFDTAASGGKAAVKIISAHNRGRFSLASDQQFFPERLDRKY
jgi:phage gp36-like protein